MGDVSNEPSMEDILSSIKRIIAEEGDAAVTTRSRRSARPASSAPAAASDDEILELIEPAPSEALQPEPRGMNGHAVHAHAPEPAVQTYAPSTPVSRATAQAPAAAPAAAHAPEPEPILSASTAEATRGRLEALSRMVVKPEVPAGETSLEGLVREMIRPMLRDWLDAHLPQMVEEMVQREISRIAGGRD